MANSQAGYRIIGISGTNGAGKDTVGQILAEHHGWLFVSVSEYLRDEARKRGLPIERENLRMISAEWRRKYGLGVLVDMAAEEFKKSNHKYKGLAVVPMRNPGEAQEVKNLGGKIVWVDADPKVRYQRIFSRARSAEDNKSFEQFLQEEKAEMEHEGDHHTLSMSGVKALADTFIDNSGNDPRVFAKEIEEKLEL